MQKSAKFVHHDNSLDKTQRLLEIATITGTPSANNFFEQYSGLIGGSINLDNINKYDNLLAKYIAKKIQRENEVLQNFDAKEVEGQLKQYIIAQSRTPGKHSDFLSYITYGEKRNGEFYIKTEITRDLSDKQRKAIETSFKSMPIDIQVAFIQHDFASTGFQSGSISSLFPKDVFTNVMKKGIDDNMVKKHLSELNNKEINKKENKEIAVEIITENPLLINAIYENNFTADSEARTTIRLSNRSTGNKDIDSAIANDKEHYIRLIQKNENNDRLEHTVFKHSKDGVYKLVSGKFTGRVKAINKKLTLDEALKMENAKNKKPGNFSKIGPEGRQEQDNHHESSDTISELSEQEYAQAIGYNYEQLQQPENANLYRYVKDRYFRYRQHLVVTNNWFSENIKTKKLKNEREWSSERLSDEFIKFTRLDSQAAKGVMDAIALELAMRSGKEQNNFINKNTNFKWDSKNDFGTIQAWLLSNNIPSKRPEIQRLVNLMEQEYRKFIDEYTTEQEQLYKLHRKLIKEKMKNRSVIDRIKLRMNATDMNQYLFGNMFIEEKYTDINGVVRVNFRLKTQDEFNASSPTKVEAEYYTYYKKTTDKFFRRYADKEGVNYSENYIPHVGMNNFEVFSSTGLYGLWNNITGKVADLDHVKVRGTIVVNGKVQEKILPLGQWKDIYLAGPVTLPGGKKIFEIEKLKRRAEQLKKEGVHDDGTVINMTPREAGELNNDGVFTRFVKGRPTDASKYATRNLTQALNTYMRASIFVYGANEFMGFKQMMPLVEGIISLNKKLGNVNAANYVEKVWKQGFLQVKKQPELGKKTDMIVDMFVKWVLYVFLGLSIPAGVVNAAMGKYNTIRSQGWRQWARGEGRLFSKDFNKVRAILKKQYQWEDQIYDNVDFSPKGVLDTVIFFPLNISEKWVQGVSFIGMMSDAEFNAYDENGNVVDNANALTEEEILKRTDKIRRNQGRGYTRIDQRLIGMYSLGRAMMQFKRWLPSMAVERFGPEDTNRFGEQEVGSWRQFGKFGYSMVQKLFSGEISVTEFNEQLKALPRGQKDATITAMRGFGLLMILAGIGLATDDDESKVGKFVNKASRRTKEDATIFFRPDNYAFTLTPASFNIANGGLDALQSFLSQERAQTTTRFRTKGEKQWKGDVRKITPLQRAVFDDPRVR